MSKGSPSSPPKRKGFFGYTKTHSQFRWARIFRETKMRHPKKYTKKVLQMVNFPKIDDL